LIPKGENLKDQKQAQPITNTKITISKFSNIQIVFNWYKWFWLGGVCIEKWGTNLFWEMVQERAEVDYRVRGRLKSIIPHKGTKWQGQDEYHLFPSSDIF
jgi:hypothetical protein